MPSFTVEGVTEAGARVFEAVGAPADTAHKVAGWLVNADRSGHPSHGIRAIPSYVEQIQSGRCLPSERPAVVVATETTVLVDGRCGFGQLAAEALTLALADKARQAGVAIGGIRNCNHIGRLGEWAELAAGLDVLFFMTTGGPGGQVVAPHGGMEGRLDTNPMTFGAPTAGDDPVIVDFATSASAFGKLTLARDAGAEIPVGQLLDKHGRPSTNPNDLSDGGVMLPFGGHKGYGLSLMAEILGSNLIGAAERQAASPRMGVFALALDPDVLGAGDRYFEATRATFERLRDTRPAEGFTQVLIPGDPERRAREAARRGPIEVPEATWRLLLDAARQVGLDPEEIGRMAGGD